MEPPSLAARFAAKEAVLKLIGTADGVDPRSVEIAHEDGRPVVRLSGRRPTLAAEAGIGRASTSASATPATTPSRSPSPHRPTDHAQRTEAHA